MNKTSVVNKNWMVVGLLAGAGLLSVTGCSAGAGSASEKTAPVGSAPAEEMTVDARAFIGTWSCSGTQVESCPTASHSDAINGLIRIVAGADPSTVLSANASNVNDSTTGTVVTVDTSATVGWTVANGMATLAGPQTLPTVPGSEGGTWTPTFMTGTGTLVGNSVAWSESGTAIFTYEGTTQTCNFTLTSTCVPQ